MKGLAGPQAGQGEGAVPKRPSAVPGRYREVDAARGVAILIVVLYHLVYDLDDLGGYPIDFTFGF